MIKPNIDINNACNDDLHHIASWLEALLASMFPIIVNLLPEVFYKVVCYSPAISLETQVDML